MMLKLDINITTEEWDRALKIFKAKTKTKNPFKLLRRWWRKRKFRRNLSKLAGEELFKVILCGVISMKQLTEYEHAFERATKAGIEFGRAFSGLTETLQTFRNGIQQGMESSE